MIYFKYPCATEQCWKAGSVVLCILMILLGGYNVARKKKTYYLDGVMFLKLYQSAKDVNILDPIFVSTGNNIF